MTERPLPPDHDAVLFALDCAWGERATALAAAAVAAAADAVHPTGARWTLAVLADTLLWADDAASRARALVEREAMDPDAAARLARCIAPVLADPDPLDGLRPRDTVAICNAHGVPRAERRVLVVLGLLAVGAAGALDARRGAAPTTVVCVAPAAPRGARPRAGLAAARLGAGAESEARAAAAERRARLAARHAGVRGWPAPEGGAVTVCVRDPNDGAALALAPFVVADTTPARTLGAARTASERDLARLVPWPPAPR